MVDPTSTTILGTINVSFKLAEYGLRLSDASEDKRIFCKLIERVHKDRAEAMRERSEKAAQLKLIPSKKAWIDGAIADTDQALFEIGRSVEPARMEGAGGKQLSLKQRFEWVLLKKETLVTRQSLLSFCHQTLSTAIAFMQDLPPDEQAATSQQHQREGHAAGKDTSPVAVSPPPSYWSPTTMLVGKQAALRGPWARRPTMKKGSSGSDMANMPEKDGFARSLSEDLERIWSDSSSISSSQPQQPQWDVVSNSETLKTAAAPFADPDEESLMSASSVDISEQTGNPVKRRDTADILNGRRRRNEARFGGSI